MSKSRLPISSPSGDSQAQMISSSSHPITRLPVEILCRIFYFTRVAPPNVGEKRFFTPRDMKLMAIDWIAVSWVCRAWRNAAVSDPSLWTDLPIDFPQWTTEMLRRSKDAGLIVSFFMNLDDNLLTAIFDQLPRIAALTVNSEKRLRILMDKFSLRATPRLVKLCLELDKYSFNEDSPPMRLPNSLFADAIHLQHLELIRVDVDWNSHLFTRPLTWLELGQISPTNKPTLSELRSIMQQLSPTLQDLNIRTAIPAEHGAQSRASSDSQISLSALKRLFLGANVSETTTFFNNFTLSDNAAVADLFVNISNGFDQDYTTMLAVIGRSEALGRIASSARCVMVIGDVVGSKAGKKWQDVQLTLRTANILLSELPENYPSNEPEYREMPGLDVLLNGPRPSSGPLPNLPFRCIFTDFFNTFQWTSLRDLSLTSAEVRGYADFGQVLVATFGSLPTIELVKVGPKVVNHLLSALSHYAPGTQNDLAFRGLTKIIMFCVNIQSRFDEIKGTLLRRRERNVPIQKLTFDDCRGKNKKYLEMITELVTEIYWDETKIEAPRRK